MSERERRGSEVSYKEVGEGFVPHTRLTAVFNPAPSSISQKDSIDIISSDPKDI